MIAPAPRSARESRLDPFAFRSATNARLLLLVVAACAVSLTLFALSYHADPVRSRAIQVGADRCTAQAFEDYPADPTGRSIYLGDCFVSVYGQRTVAQLAGLAALVATAGVLHRLLPALMLWWRKLRAVTLDHEPALVRYLAGLCREAGLRRLPTFLIDPRQRTPGEAVFGRAGRYTVILSAALVTTFHTDRPTFRAVVLHDLAHLRNRDLDTSYLAQGIWLAFLLIALVPYGLSSLLLPFGSSPVTLDAVQVGWQVATAALLVSLLYIAVLRSRELYADARVAATDEDGDALRRVIGTIQVSPVSRAWAHWWDALGHHPGPATRRRLLDDPGSLVSAGIGEAFAAGLIAGLALTTVDAFLWPVLPAELGERGAAMALLLVPPAAGVIVPNIWRAACAELREGQRPRGIGRAGMALGLGYVLGLHAAPGGQAIVAPGSGGLSLAGPIPGDLAAAGLLAGSLALLFRALAAVVAAWLRTHASGSDLRAARVFTIAQVVGSGLLTVWLHRFTSSVYASRWASPDALVDTAPAGLGLNAVVALLDPLMLAALGALLACSLVHNASRLARC